MEPANRDRQQAAPKPEDARYLQFKHSQPGSGLNKFSSALTREHDFPAAQAMLYAAGVPSEKALKTFPQVGVVSKSQDAKHGAHIKFSQTANYASSVRPQFGGKATPATLTYWILGKRRSGL